MQRISAALTVVALTLATPTLAALVAACSESPTNPAKKTPAAAAADFVDGGGAAAAAGQSVLCANRSGSVFVRAQCLPAEQQLDPAALGLVGPAISGYQIVAHQVFVPPGPGATHVHVECPAGKRVLGGGFSIETPTDMKVYASESSDGQGNFSDHAWDVLVRNDGTATRQTTASAICASAQ